MLTSDKYPGYGYWLKNGASSIWEYWRTGERSENHFAFGTVDDFFYKYLAEIKMDGIEYSTSVIKPYMLGDLTAVTASTQTVRGKVASAWVKGDDGRIKLTITIPINTTSTVYVPLKTTIDTVMEGTKLASESTGVTSLGVVAYALGIWAKYTVASGTYTFSVIQ